MPAPRKPTHLKIIAGTLQKCRTNKAEPKPARSALQEPPHLTCIEQIAWKKAVAVLDAMGVLTVADEMALEQLVTSYAQIVVIKEAIAKLPGPTYETTTQTGGTMRRPYPEFTMLNEAQRVFRSYLTAFGLTPADRSRVSGTPNNGEDNPFSGL